MEQKESPRQGGVSPQIQAALNAARAKIQNADGSETSHYQAYKKYKEDYQTASRALDRAYSSAFADPVKLNEWPINGVSYQDDKNDAFEQWTAFGFKNEIEEAEATLAAQGIDPSILLIKRAKEKYNDSLFNFPGLGNLPYVLFNPPSWYDRDGDGFTDYTSTEFHSESHYSSSSTSYGGGGGFSVGFWSVGSDFNSSESRQSASFQTNGLEISLSYSVVDIRRPWLDTSLLNLGNWFIVGDYKKHCISNGQMGQHLPAGGVEPAFLPSVVTSLILVKDLSIKWDNWQTQWSTYSQSLSTSGSIGYGPFAVHGHYSHHSEKRDFYADASGESLVVPGIQLIGYVSAISPPSPQKDSAPYMSSDNNPTH